MFQDEAGFGRINKPKRCWCAKGHRPTVPCHHIREYRYLYGAVSPLEVLPAIRAALPKAVPMLMDSGVRQGTDVLKAIALGASAVMVGRPQMHALAVAGMLGVAHMLYLLRAELELAMAQTGCATLADAQPQLLVK